MTCVFFFLLITKWTNVKKKEITKRLIGEKKLPIHPIFGLVRKGLGSMFNFIVKNIYNTQLLRLYYYFVSLVLVNATNIVDIISPISYTSII
jgi:hypothetical protein